VQFDSSASRSKQQQQVANNGAQEAISLQTFVKRMGLDNLGEVILAKAFLVIPQDPPEALAKLSSKAQLQQRGLVLIKEHVVSLGLVGEVFSAKYNRYEGNLYFNLMPLVSNSLIIHLYIQRCAIVMKGYCSYRYWAEK
jgi:hypothetical protein